MDGELHASLQGGWVGKRERLEPETNCVVCDGGGSRQGQGVSYCGLVWLSSSSHQHPVVFETATCPSPPSQESCGKDCGSTSLSASASGSPQRMASGTWSPSSSAPESTQLCTRYSVHLKAGMSKATQATAGVLNGPQCNDKRSSTIDWREAECRSLARV